MYARSGMMGLKERGGVPMGRTSASVKNRYAMKNYDRIITLVPKGQKRYTWRCSTMWTSVPRLR